MRQQRTFTLLSGAHALHGYSSMTALQSSDTGAMIVEKNGKDATHPKEVTMRLMVTRVIGQTCFRSKRQKPRTEELYGALCYKKRRCPTLPHSRPCSTIGAKELNFRVRNGNGWILFAMTAVKQKSDDRGQKTDESDACGMRQQRTFILSYNFAFIPEKHGDKLLYGNPSKGEGLPRVANN